MTCKVAEVCHHGALSQLALVQIVLEPQELLCHPISVVRLVCGALHIVWSVDSQIKFDLGVLSVLMIEYTE